MEPNKKQQTKRDTQPKRDKVELDRTYGAIGISAVRAAVESGRGQRKQSASEAPKRTTSKYPAG